ncbi:hypothetical protein BJ322DRAFT_802415 [Thelephora terrestris]|uniref:F-box domain-containing protein n=1 Tax=Thelephora terrestris TaxID=56493 RepID=A0A9P6L632_9AGAM|nr:hypothetical protein BJ322DRAFT_802415 [Thelephora terrestris]
MPPSAPTNNDRMTQQVCRVESNLKSIRDLEDQIREHEMAIVKLKRARNSFLSVSKLPPEILGDIFRWNVVLKADFERLGEGSHNFLLVCHHWYEVASCTPELWSFWGDNLYDWARRHLRHPKVPLDLVFNGLRLIGGTLDDSLKNTLHDRAARDTIRRIHLTGEDSETLDSIISPLAGCEEIRTSSVESVVLRDMTEEISVDVSDFLAYYRFPKLQRLELENCTISSWDLIASKTSVLTALTLFISYPSPTITSPQILSLLRSNPSLREISLYGCSVPDDGGCKSGPRVTLAHLKELALAGHPQDVFALLHQLDYPTNMDNLVLNLMDSTVEDISETIGPFIRDYLRRRGKSQTGLGLYISSEESIELRVEDIGVAGFSAPEPLWLNTLVETIIHLDPMPPADVLEEALLDLIAYVPREEIVFFQACNSTISADVMSTQLPYLVGIRFEETPLDVAFPKSTLDHGEIFPHLQHLSLHHVVIRRGGWSPLTTFLDHLAASGKRLDTLEIHGFCDMHPGLEERVRRAVREFRVQQSYSRA